MYLETEKKKEIFAQYGKSNVDTGSTDNTLKLVRPFNPRIFKYSWDSNFGNARNQSLLHATGDWILVLDADEAIYSEDVQKLMDIVQTTKSNEIIPPSVLISSNA